MKRFPFELPIAFGSGVLMSLAAAPLNWWGLAWIALIPLWTIAVQAGANTRRSLLCTLIWGLGYHGLTLSWIWGLHPLTWMGVPWLASVAVTLFCWLFITLWGTTTNLAWTWVMGRMGTKSQALVPKLIRVLVGTALWCATEFLLNLTPLSWTSLSFTQSPGNLVVLHLGRLSGPLIVTAAIVAVNGLLAEAWMQTRLMSQNSRVVKTLVAIAGGVFVAAHAIGFGFYSHPLADSNANALTVGIVQGNIPTREKLSNDGIRRAIQAYVGGYEALVDQGADAVLTPEGSLPFLWDKERNPFAQAVTAKGIPAWLGIFVEEDSNITQSLLSLANNGRVVGHYNKIKLVPLGEYIPFPDTIGQLIGRLSPIKSSMVPGQMHQQFDTPFGQAIASICYDSVFSEVFRAQAATGGQFILTASNLDPYSEVLMKQHQAQDLMRAIETDRWAARATNTGYSSFIDPHGHVIWRSQPRVYDVHAAQIYRRQTRSLYVQWGDWFTPLLLALAALMFALQHGKISPLRD